jgi:predicted nucleic acid-binding Zn ribbon protein
MPFYKNECEACGKKLTLLESITIKVMDGACPYCKEKKKGRKLSDDLSSGKNASCGTGFTWGGG